MTTFTLPYPPSTNRLWRGAGRHTYLSPEARAYKNTVALIVGQALPEPLQGDIRIRMDVYRPARRGDLDNRLKAVLDGLNSAAYEDDSQIVHIEATRHDQPKVKGERREGYVIVTVEAL